LDDDASFDQLVRELEAGQLDHAPLALPLWPDRVIEQCLHDAEFAEGHGLRQYFWTAHGGEGWRRRKAVAAEVRDEVARRQGWVL
jgi:hypothetical protein